MMRECGTLQCSIETKIQILIEIQVEAAVCSVYLSPPCFHYIALLTKFHSSPNNVDNVDDEDDDKIEEEDVYDAQLIQCKSGQGRGSIG